MGMIWRNMSFIFCLDPIEVINNLIVIIWGWGFGNVEKLRKFLRKAFVETNLKGKRRQPEHACWVKYMSTPEI